MIAEVSCSHLDTFIQKIRTRSLRVGIVGLGYVGLPLARLFTSQGFRVLGLDIDQAKIRKLMSGETYIGHIPASVVQEMRNDNRLVATSDFSRVEEADTGLRHLRRGGEGAGGQKRRRGAASAQQGATGERHRARVLGIAHGASQTFAGMQKRIPAHSWHSLAATDPRRGLTPHD